MFRILMLLLLAVPAFGQGLPMSKPPPLGAAIEQPQASGPAQAQPPARCPAVLANACLAQQGSCQVACPPMWSTNPGAPAFTPTNRAGCMQRCFHEYLSCRRMNGC